MYLAYINTGSYMPIIIHSWYLYHATLNRPVPNPDTLLNSTIYGDSFGLTASKVSYVNLRLKEEEIVRPSPQTTCSGRYGFLENVRESAFWLLSVAYRKCCISVGMRQVTTWEPAQLISVASGEITNKVSS